jgi:hypothetical protein
MKKTAILLIMLALMISLSGCAATLRIEIDDTIESPQSNASGWLFNPIMKTDAGFYYSDTQGNLQLRYFDKATGLDIFLCAKPECQHDGGTFCPATGTGDSFEPVHTILYDGYLYIYGYEKDDENTTAVLYRANPDGTALNKLTDLITVTGSRFISFNDMKGIFIIHRGKAFVTFYTGNDFRGLIMIDLTTLNHEIIVESSFSIHGSQWSPDNLMAAGDYLYYTLMYSTKSFIYRYNIITGKHERMCGIQYMSTSYVIIGDEIWHSNTGGYIFIYDILTGEQRQFGGLEQYREATAYVNENGREIRERFHGCEIMYDGDYLYVSSESKMMAGFFTANRTKRIHIFTLGGEHLAAFTYEACTPYFAQMAVLDSVIYWQTPSRIDSCSVEGLLSGDYEWKTELEFQNLTSTAWLENWAERIR